MPGISRRRATVSSRSAPRIQPQSALGDGGAAARRPRRGRHGERLIRQRQYLRRPGNGRNSPGGGGRAVVRQAGQHRARGGHRDLLTDTPRTAISKPSTAPRHPHPGSFATRRRARDRRRALASTATGSASRSSNRRHGPPPAEVAHVGQAQRAVTCPVTGRRVPARRRAPAAAPGGTSGVDTLLDARDRAVAEEAPQRLGVQRRAVRAAAASRVPRPRWRRRPPTQRPAVRRTPRRTVSLNCRTLANPAANATSATGRSVVSMQDPGGLRPLGAGQRERPGAQLGGEHRCRWRSV